MNAFRLSISISQSRGTHFLRRALAAELEIYRVSHLLARYLAAIPP